MRALLEHAAILEGGIAVAVVAGTSALLRLPMDGPLLVLAFCGTAAVYGLDRAAGFSAEDRLNCPARVAWWRQRRGVVVLFTTVGAAMLPTLEPATVMTGAVLAGLSLLYVVPLLPGRRRLKEIAALKSAVIGLGWGMGGVVLPIVEAGTTVGAAAVLLVAARTLGVSANALLSDWPDRRGDARAGVATLAVRWPWQCLRRWALAALAAATAAEAGLLAFLPPGLVLVDAVGPVVFMLLVLRLDPAHPRFSRLLDVAVAWPAVTALAAWGA